MILNKILTKTIIYFFLIFFAVVTLFPFLWTFYVSFVKDVNNIGKFSLSLSDYGFDNFIYLFSKIQAGSWYFNSIVTTLGITFANLIFNSMAGYSLARINYPGRSFIFWIVLGVMLVPFQITMVPVYMLLIDWNFVNSFKGLIIPFMFNSFGIFLMRQFFLGIPKELEEAARVDGLSKYGIFTKIMLPLAKTALITQFIIIFMWNWNSFIWPCIISNESSMYTLAVGINTVKSQYFSVPTTVMAGVVVLTVPVLLVFIILQKYFIRGIAGTGIK